MTSLNHETFQKLKQASEDSCLIKGEGKLKWYDLTYELFKNSSLDSLDDFWRIVAFTYSWMPTIPEIYEDEIKDGENLLVKLKGLKNGDSSHLKSLLEELVPVINNSLVGTSKVLHFIAPEQVPIIDRNVLKGWNIFFTKHHPDSSIIKLPSYQTALGINHIGKYLQFRDTLIAWVKNINVNVCLRDIEYYLFKLGRSTEKEVDKAINFQ